MRKGSGGWIEYYRSRVGFFASVLWSPRASQRVDSSAEMAMHSEALLRVLLFGLLYNTPYASWTFR